MQVRKASRGHVWNLAKSANRARAVWCHTIRTIASTEASVCSALCVGSRTFFLHAAGNARPYHVHIAFHAGVLKVGQSPILKPLKPLQNRTQSCQTSLGSSHTLWRWQTGKEHVLSTWRWIVPVFRIPGVYASGVCGFLHIRVSRVEYSPCMCPRLCFLAACSCKY